MAAAHWLTDRLTAVPDAALLLSCKSQSQLEHLHMTDLRPSRVLSYIYVCLRARPCQDMPDRSHFGDGCAAYIGNHTLVMVALKDKPQCLE